MCQFKYAVKHDEHGNVDKLKARLIAHGMCQVYGQDYTESFAATSQVTSVITFLTYALQTDLTVRQMDVQAAFVNATLTETIYVSLPPQLGHHRRYALLNKSLYGLKQAAACWAKASHALIMSIPGMRRNATEPCWYTLTRADGLVAHLLVYVDDYLLATNSVAFHEWFVAYFNKSYVLKDLGLVKHYMGIGVKYTNGTMELTRGGAILATVTKYGVTDMCGSELPMVAGNGDRLLLPKTDADNHSLFRALLGELLYHCRTCRPDIRLALALLSRFSAKNTTKHYEELLRVLKYLKHTPDFALVIRKGPGGALGSMQLRMYVDASYRSIPESLKSVSGWVIFLNGSIISCNAKRQETTAGSSTEAEIIAFADALNDLRFVWQLLKQFAKVELPMIVYEDNNATIAAFTNVSAGKTKYIDVKYMVGRELVEDGTISVHRVDSKHNVADFFTKPLEKKLHDKFVQAFMGHTQIEFPPIFGRGGVLQTEDSQRDTSE
jgi:hypothetical protein